MKKIMFFTTAIMLAVCFQFQPANATVGGGIEELSDGKVKYSITLPSGQEFVQLFVRQNGIQNFAEAI